MTSSAHPHEVTDVLPVQTVAFSVTTTSPPRLDSGIDVSMLDPGDRSTLNVLEDPNLDDTRCNDRLVVLVRTGKSWVRDYLTRSVSDARYTKRWRNYCVQHLSDWYLRYKDDKSLRVLSLLASTPQSPVCDVAIYSLARALKEVGDADEGLSRNTFRTMIAINLRSVGQSPEEIASKEGAISALVLVGDHAFDQDVLLNAGNSSAPMGVRLAAISACAALRPDGAADFLRSQLQSAPNGGIIAKCILAALRKLSESPSQAEGMIDEKPHDEVRG